jgi:hypothetical protein
MKKTLILSVLAAVIGIGTTVASAQEGLHWGRKYGGPPPAAVERLNTVSATEANVTIGGREGMVESLGN